MDGKSMNMYEDEIISDGCPICKSPESAIIEFDRPVVMLCECSNCGKFIIKEKTLQALEQEKEFEKNRKNISDFIRNFFEESGQPLEIVKNMETALTEKSLSIVNVFKKIQNLKK
ncbi:MAG: hypothetical protein SV375_15295 [Thermodesulfobacteriota bacterium]|nr:hypothetical protein [Thermodesulfobacteriota bacterium]